MKAITKEAKAQAQDVRKAVYAMAKELDMPAHDRQNRIILKKGSRRALMFRINQLNQTAKVFINDTVIDDDRITQCIIDNAESVEAHEDSQITVGFHTTVDMTLAEIEACVQMMRAF